MERYSTNKKSWAAPNFRGIQLFYNASPSHFKYAPYKCSVSSGNNFWRLIG